LTELGQAIHGHLVPAFLSYICVALARLWSDRLKPKTLGWIKRHLFQALAELAAVLSM
jgi:hypothetical protein